MSASLHLRLVDRQRLGGEGSAGETASDDCDSRWKETVHGGCLLYAVTEFTAGPDHRREGRHVGRRFVSGSLRIQAAIGECPRLVPRRYTQIPPACPADRSVPCYPRAAQRAQNAAGVARRIVPFFAILCSRAVAGSRTIRGARRTWEEMCGRSDRLEACPTRARHPGNGKLRNLFRGRCYRR